MALNNDTNFPPSGLAPYRIDRAWCLGDSLPYLNANFTNFDNRIDANTTALASASATLNTTIASTSSTVITTLSTVPYARLNDGNQSGVAPIFGARAWVNFDGTRNAGGTLDASNTTRFIRGSGNITSVLKNNTGDYTLTFSIPMADADYCIFGLTNEVVEGNRSSGWTIRGTDSSYMTPTTCRISVGSQSSGGAADLSVITVAIIR